MRGGAIVVLLMIVAVAGCNLRHDGDRNGVTTPSGVGVTNAIFGAADGANWGVLYQPGASFAMVQIPFAAAVRISYTTTTGGPFEIYAESSGAFKVEIGLTETDGQIAMLDSIGVEYLENGAFASVPDDAQAVDSARALKQIVVIRHYGRHAGGVIISWWQPGAAFVFNGQTQFIWLWFGGQMADGVIVVTGPFPKPVDRDGDGVDDAYDNCVGVANPDQADSNGNGVGNACDTTTTTTTTTTRFIDHGNGTVTDTTTGKIWLKDAGCGGLKNWLTALSWAPTVKGDGTMCGLTDGSTAGAWHLPTKAEWQALTGGTCDNTCPDWKLPVSHPFSGVGTRYWTSIAVGSASWAVDVNSGNALLQTRTAMRSAWAVR